MNTKTLMTLSAIVLGATGILFTFMPQEVLALLQTYSNSTHPLDALILQLMGAMYFGFAMINWTAKANLIGGIYGRPIAIGNFVHFAVGALAILKVYISTHEAVLIAPTLIYALFAIVFGLVFFTHPVKES
jgi:hypothetical protein